LNNLFLSELKLARTKKHFQSALKMYYHQNLNINDQGKNSSNTLKKGIDLDSIPLLLNLNYLIVIAIFGTNISPVTPE
jgi:hypothetical protein